MTSETHGNASPDLNPSRRQAVFAFGRPLFVPPDVLGTEVLSIELAANDLGIQLQPAHLSLLPQVAPSISRQDQEAITARIAELAWAGQQG